MHGLKDVVGNVFFCDFSVAAARQPEPRSEPVPQERIPTDVNADAQHEHIEDTVA